MSARVRIKVCGITTPEQALAVSNLGVDALGLVFVEKSARYLSLSAAREVRDVVPPFVQVVALFLDAQAHYVEQVIDFIRPDLLQFHGDESVLDCERWRRPYLRAVAMGSNPDLADVALRYSGASGFLLDGHQRGELGGQGTVFDWSKVPDKLGKPMIIAGGLKPANVAQAIQTTRPYGVDVSSGVESSPGLKDLGLVHEFISEVNSATSCQK